MTIFFDSEQYTDINPYFMGYEKCEPCHNFLQGKCDFLIIHYCVKGRGIIKKEDMIYKVSEKQIFIINPEDTIYYEADSIEPWEYIWIAFKGNFVSKLSSLPPVISIDTDIFIQIRDKIEDNNPDKLFIAGKVFEIYSEILHSKTEQKIDYAKNVMLYIQLKYAEKITVEEIAAQLRIDRRYMTRLFKQKYNTTVIDYLVEYRLKKAAARLKSGMAVSQAALLSGYSDVFNFSKMFKRKYGISPSEYRLRYSLRT